MPKGYSDFAPKKCLTKPRYGLLVLDMSNTAVLQCQMFAFQMPDRKPRPIQ